MENFCWKVVALVKSSVGFQNAFFNNSPKITHCCNFTWLILKLRNILQSTEIALCCLWWCRTVVKMFLKRAEKMKNIFSRARPQNSSTCMTFQFLSRILRFDLNLKLVGAFNGTTWSGNIQKGFLMFNMQSLVGGN